MNDDKFRLEAADGIGLQSFWCALGIADIEVVKVYFGGTSLGKPLQWRKTRKDELEQCSFLSSRQFMINIPLTINCGKIS